MPNTTIGADAERAAFDRWRAAELPAGCVSDMERGWMARAALASAAQPAAAQQSEVEDTLVEYAMQIAHERELHVLGYKHDSEGALQRFRSAVARFAAAPKAAPAPARWYMVNCDGMATLCADRQDAEREAADVQAAWPHMGPHRAVQMVEVTAAPSAQAAPQQELLAEIQRLQRALAFWLPHVPSEDHPLQDRIAHDAFLLAGYSGPDEPSANELGHVALTIAPAPSAQGDALDTERLDWLTFNISGKALRDIGVIWSEHSDARRAIDAARAAEEGENHDQ